MDYLLYTSESGRMATFFRKLKRSPAISWERAKLFQEPLSQGKKILPKTSHWHKPNHSKSPHRFLHRTSVEKKEEVGTKHRTEKKGTP